MNKNIHTTKPMRLVHVWCSLWQGDFVVLKSDTVEIKEIRQKHEKRSFTQDSFF